MHPVVEAQLHLENMKAHTDCCGTPIVRKLLAHIELLGLRAAKAKHHVNLDQPQTAIGALDGHYDSDLR